MCRRLYATTHAPGIRVRIFVNPRVKHWALTGRSTIDIAPGLLKKTNAFQARILLHELVHVIENHVRHEDLTPVTVSQCTALARTMEKKLTPLILNLKVRKGANPFRA